MMVARRGKGRVEARVLPFAVVVLLCASLFGAVPSPAEMRGAKVAMPFANGGNFGIMRAGK